MECFKAIVNSFQWLTNAVKVSVLGVCVGPGYSYVAILYGWHVFKFTLYQSVAFMQIIISHCQYCYFQFCVNVSSSIFLYWYSHSHYKKIFVNLITVAVFQCRYIIEKDVVESFCKKSLFLVEYSLSVCLSVSLCVSLSLYPLFSKLSDLCPQSQNNVSITLVLHFYYTIL